MANLLGQVAIELERIEKGDRGFTSRDWLGLLMAQVGQVAHYSYLADRAQVRSRLIRLAAEALAAVDTLDRAHEARIGGPVEFAPASIYDPGPAQDDLGPGGLGGGSLGQV